MSNNPNKPQQQNGQSKQTTPVVTAKDAAQEAQTPASEQTTSTTSPTEGEGQAPAVEQQQEASKEQAAQTGDHLGVSRGPAPGATDLGVKDTTAAQAPKPVEQVDNTKELATQRAAAFAVGAAGVKQQAKGRTVQLPPMPVVREAPVKGFGTEAPLTSQPLADWLKEMNNVNVSSLYERLAYLDAKLGPGNQSTAEEAAGWMADTYTVIVNAVERETDDREFNAIWTLIMRMITETPKGGFAAFRLWRGKPFWRLSHAKFQHFEAVWNLIDATVRHGKGYKSFVNDRKVMQGFTGGAQGRLGTFYRMLG